MVVSKHKPIPKASVVQLKAIGIYNHKDSSREKREKVNIVRILGYLSSLDTKRGMIHYNSWLLSKTKKKVIELLEDKGFIRVYKCPEQSLPIVVESLKYIPVNDTCRNYTPSDKVRIYKPCKVPEGLFVVWDHKTRKCTLVPIKFDFNKDKVEEYSKYCFKKLSQKSLQRLLLT